MSVRKKGDTEAELGGGKNYKKDVTSDVNRIYSRLDWMFHILFFRVTYSNLRSRRKSAVKSVSVCNRGKG